MSAVLVPCPECARHVRAAEPRCPFCAAALPTDLARRAVPDATDRMSRAALLLFGATLAVAGCSGSGDAGAAGGGAGSSSSSGSATTPPPAEGSGGATGADAGEPTPAPAPMYGAAPAPVSATDDAGSEQIPRGAGLVALYGAPPPTAPQQGAAAPEQAPPADAGARRPRRR